MWKRVGTAFGLVAAAAALGACSTIGDWGNQDSFDDRLEALDSVYAQGKEARRSMERNGVIVDEASCNSSWVTSGAKDAEDDMAPSRSEDEDFQELRHLSFVNGCMDRPNQLPPVNAPSLKATPSKA